jgi:hypothetical protein
LAGLGRKEFNSGDILLASEVQGYLQDQAVMVFDDATARGSAIPSPTQGMVTYRKDDDVIESFDGSAFVAVGATDAGLIHIKTELFTNVSGVSFNDVFTTDYKDYFIKVVSTGTSADGAISLRLRAGGTDESSSVYNRHGVGADGSSVAAFVTTTATSIGYNVANRRNCQIETIVFRPQTNTQTNFLGRLIQTQLGGGAPYAAPSVYTLSANHGNNYQADGFSLIFSVNQDGYAMVYGYKD